MYTNIGLLRTSRAARLAAEAEYLHDPNPDKKRNEAAPELELVCVNHVMHPHEMHPPCTVHCVSDAVRQRIYIICVCDEPIHLVTCCTVFSYMISMNPFTV